MSRKLSIKIGGSVYTIPLDNIVYLENELRKIRLYLVDGELLFYGTFRQILPALDDHFLCCSRSYIANMDHIHALRQCGQYEIMLDNGQSFSLSKKSFLEVKSRFNAYLQKNTAKTP